MRHEALKQNIPHLKFIPEAYYSSSDPEFLDAFLELLRKNNFDPDQLVFSGFEGKDFVRGGEIPKYPYIFAMNEAGWREVRRPGEQNPADYAQGWDIPCIGLYDKTQLAEIYSSNIELGDQDDLDDQDDMLESRVKLSDITLGHALADMPTDKPVVEAVAHKDYPNGSPTDALVGLVFIQDH
jgi:hypothetical protein